jgi:TonB-dependent receptor
MKTIVRGRRTSAYGICGSPASWLGFVFASLIFLLPVAVSAQGTATGTISGTVIDTAAGKYLEGAEVIVKGTELYTGTDREGRFILLNVPAGAHEVAVVYPGMNTQTVAVDVTAGQTSTLTVKLASEVVTMSAVRVTETKEGMAQAVALQKISMNTKIVAAGDQYGFIAEGNAAEYLKFLPGVGVDYNANDARAVALRGMNTAFTNVTMDGNPLASATSGNLNRRFEFEQVSINNVETVEVYKTLTPEMPGTSTGGTINMVTKSAFDRTGNLINYRAYLQADNSDLYLKKTEGWGQEKTRKILPGIDLNAAFRIGNKLGVNLNYKNSQLFNDYPRSQYTWEYNPANGGLPTNPALTSWNLQNEQKDTRRQSMSGRIDYRLGPNTKMYVVGQWSYYDLLFTDRTITVNTGALTALATTSSPAFGNGTVNGLAGKGSVVLGTINRWKSGVTWDSSVNLEHDMGKAGSLTASIYWSQAYSKYRDTTGSWYADSVMQRTGLTVGFDSIGKVAPSYRVTDSTGAAVDLSDASKFSASQMRSRPQTGVDSRDGFSLDYKLALPTTMPIAVRAGVRLDDTTRNIENRVYNRTSFSPAVTGAPLAALVDTGFANHPIGYGLPAYPFLNPYAAYTQLGGLPYLPWTPASDTVAWFDDTTKAAYVRFDVTPLTHLDVVAGVRYENRVTNAQNRLSTLASIANGKFIDKRYFPSINLKYTPTRNLVFRLGAAKSIGLPDYSVLLPGPPSVTQPDLTNNVRGKVNIYNSKLQPYKVDNFDASVEYYFSRSGMVSLSVFRKNFTNYIVQTTQTLTDDLVTSLGVDRNALTSAVGQYDVTYNYNAPEPGHYTGMEFSFAQNLTFLPKPFNTLGLQANATILSIDPIKSQATFSLTDANLNLALRDQIQKALEISAVKQSFNLQLNYYIGKFAFNIISNYTGHVLKSGTGTGTVSGNGAIVMKTVKYSDVAANNYYNELQYQAPRATVDLRIDYKWDQRYTLYFEARNVLSRPIVIATPILPFNHAEYGDPIYEIGVRGSF